MATLRYLIPTPLKKSLKFLLYSIQDFFAWLRGGKDPDYPPKRLNFVGSHDFKKVGDEFVRLFVEYGRLKPTDSVLDIGCGIGRMAIPLSSFLKGGSYSGFDIDRRGVEWCQKNLSPRHPHFSFAHADIYNRFYNKKGRIQAHDFRFPYEDASFDFVFATSVFTHMLAEDVEQYLREIQRVSKNGATIFLTFFLLNPRSRDLMQGPHSRCSFRFAHNPICFYSHRDVKEAEIAYDEDWILKRLRAYDLDHELKLHYGSWCGREAPLSYQDILISHKA